MAGNGGEARRRREAADLGAPIPAPKQCPVKRCKSRRIMRHGPHSKLAKVIARAWGNTVTCAIDQCRECGAIWEPWPDDDPGDLYRDDVTREPCDTCAYRAGSGESKDPKRWAKLKELPKKAATMSLVDPGRPQFCCHKGVPIKISQGDQEGSIEFDYEAAGIDPLQQTCSGFLRVLWRFNGASNGHR